MNVPPDSTQSILVVDDHAEIRTFLRMALEQAGYEIQEASNGKDAIEMLRSTPCDLVLTDMVMPDGEGAQLLLDLKKEFPRTSIIVMTGGSGTKDYGFIAKGFGAHYVLYKPFSNDELIMTVQTAFSTRK